MLRETADAQCLRFRESFVGQTVEVIVERNADDRRGPADNRLRHGRCERYFDVLFEDPTARPGDTRRIRVTRAAGGETFGEVVA
jgi:tRNA A37 methylthiotransferase MiaB